MKKAALPQKDRIWRLTASPALHAALLKEQKRRKIDNAGELLRVLLAEALGDESLAESRRGRPPAKAD